MAAGVAAAVRGLYVAFAEPIRAAPAGCPCCVDPADGTRLMQVRREELGGEAFERYASKAMTTWGDERDFRWFLPRIAELVAAEGGCGALDPEAFAQKIVYGGWDAWSADQRSAVIAYFDALWARELAEPDPDPIRVLEALAALGVDLAGWLGDVAVRGSARVLAALVEHVYVIHRDPLAAQVRAAVVRGAVQERLIAAYVDDADDRIARAADFLACERELPP